MKKLSFFLPLSSFIIVFLILNPSIPATRGIKFMPEPGKSLYLYKDYYALVVGISDYQKWPKLPNAANDAKEVAEKLKMMGFEVKLLMDPSSSELKNALNALVYGEGREENRAILFYYAGHGETEILVDGTHLGYIIPKDCPLLKEDPMGFSSLAISMKDIEYVSLKIRSKHVIMLFDSCFSGAIFTLKRAAPSDITEKSALPVRQFITAGSENEQVPDKSMFKRNLLIGLDGDADLTTDGYITGSELGMYLSNKVVNYTNSSQHPQYGKINNPDLDRGDFIFVLPETVTKEDGVGKPPQEVEPSKVKSSLDQQSKKKAKTVRNEALYEKLRGLLADMESIHWKKPYPRLMILLGKESQGGFIAEQTLIEFFRSKGFHVVDSEVIGDARYGEDLRGIGRDRNANRRVGRRYGAEILISGSIETSSFSTKTYGTELNTNRAIISAKVIMSKTGEVMVSGTEESKQPGVKGSIKEPVEEATAILAQKLMQKISRWWRRELSDRVHISVALEGIGSNEEINYLSKFLFNQVRGLEGITLRDFKGDRAEFSFSLRGKADHLAHDFIQFQLDGLNIFSIKSEETNRLVVVFE